MADQVKYTKNKLAGQRVLVIGGTSGIGFAVAEALVEHDAIVTVSSSQPGNVSTAVSRLATLYPSREGHVTGQACDVGGDDAALESRIVSLLEFATAQGAHKLDHIVMTAGDGLQTKHIRDASVAELHKGTTTRVLAGLVVAKHVERYMQAGPAASVVFTTGSVSERPSDGWAINGAWLGAQHTMTKALALDFRPRRFNLVSPGPVRTELWSRTGMTDAQRDALLADLATKTTTGRILDAADLVHAYLYLLRDANITGACISTSSGVLLT